MLTPHLHCCNNHFYFRIRIPVDLTSLFPTIIYKKSLKTTDVKAAKVMAVSLEYKFQQIFTMIRSGMLTDDLVRDMVAEQYAAKARCEQVCDSCQDNKRLE